MMNGESGTKSLSYKRGINTTLQYMTAELYNVHITYIYLRKKYDVRNKYYAFSPLILFLSKMASDTNRTKLDNNTQNSWPKVNEVLHCNQKILIH